MILEIDNLVKKYGDKTVLNSASFAVDQGEVFCLCGESGSGKTTLLRIIAGLLSFDEGKLTLGRDRITADDLYPDKLYGCIGVAFQDNNLFPHLTVKQNVQLALHVVKKYSKSDAAHRAMTEIQKMGLESRANAYPGELSGGEKKRAAIARALVMDPMMLLMDEPTSDLDPSKTGEIVSLIQYLSEKGITMLIVTHNVQFGRAVGDHYAILNDGKISVSRDHSHLDAFERKYI